MRIKVMWLVPVLFLLMMISSSSWAAPMTQGEFAMLLVRVLGMEGSLPTAATVEDYCDLLSSLGLEPYDGWNPDAPLTRGILSEILGILPEGDRNRQLTLEEVLRYLEEWIEAIPTFIPTFIPVSAV